jgi:hypothetical protein
MHASEFRAGDDGPAIVGLFEPGRLPELGPGSPCVEAYDSLRQLGNKELFGQRPIADANMASACLAGLWLYHDFLDESHRISQEIHTPTGSLWHAIMHRREGDYSNSKYWFRQVGEHPIFPRLHQAAMKLIQAAGSDSPCSSMAAASRWDPFGFVDLCQKALASGAKWSELCRLIQLLEWQILFDHCFRAATESDSR